MSRGRRRMMNNTLQEIASKLAIILLIAGCRSFLPAARCKTRLTSTFPSVSRRDSPILNLYNDPSDKNTEVKVFSDKDQLQRLAQEHKETLEKLKQAHAKERKSLELKIEDLREKLDTGSAKALLEKASELQKDLKKEIKELSRKLVDAEARSLKFSELEVNMTKKQRALEEEVKTLRGDYEERKDWKTKYEKESVEWRKQEEEYLAEIQRLEQEVRVVFSIGRRTSDKLVEELGAELKEKELNMTAQKRALDEKDEYIGTLEQERKSLRRLSWLGIKVTGERLRLQLARLRKNIGSKIAGKALPSRKEISSNSTVPVPNKAKRRTR